MKNLKTTVQLWLTLALATLLASPQMLAHANSQLRARLGDPQRGSGSTEIILLILGIVVIAGVVVAAITAFISRKAAELG